MLAEAAGVVLVLAVTFALAFRDTPTEYDWETFRRAQSRLWLLVAGVLVWLVVAEDAGLASLNHPPVGELAPSAALAFITIGVTGIVTGLAMRSAGRGIDPATRALLDLPRGRALALVVATGVAEELLFRGYLLTRVVAVAGSEGAGVVVSAAAFAAFRATGLNRAQGVQVAVLGVAIAVAFAYTGSLLAVVVARVGYDALTTAATSPDELGGAGSAQS